MSVENLSASMQTIGQYDLVEKIAEGGMGTVYRGRHQGTGEIVAVKVVPQHLLSNPVVLKRFEQEYTVAKSIDHPNIVKALDFGRDGETRYLVMEYVEGESLGQKIEREGKMEEAEAIRIISLVALGLQKAHSQGLVHRDVKPDNILLTADGQAKLTDLGLVKEVEADLNLTRTGRGLGTPHFMAPEQFRNAKKADVRCDIYSLGATLYMMVTGELPFKSNGPLDAWMKKINHDIAAPRTVVPTLSERVDWAIRRAIDKEPTSRPENCREFVEDLTGHSTKVMPGTEPNMPPLSEYWYMVYTDDAGEVHTVKGTIKGIRRSFKEGLLGDAENVRVARVKAGPYEPLRAYPEFRDLVIKPTGTGPSSASKLKQASEAAIPAAPPPAATDSNVLATTTILPSARGISKEGEPCIQLQTSGSTFAADIWKWVAMGVICASAGVLATYLMPLLRHIRF
jgi:serine/threonine protein kinase